jgi:hypothetical protein
VRTKFLKKSFSVLTSFPPLRRLAHAITATSLLRR